MPSYSLSHLSDHAVTRDLDSSTGVENQSIAANLARIAEFDRRELYLPAGYRSMFRYCVERLRMSEDAALQRIRAARAARHFPAIFHALGEAQLHLTAVVLLAPHLTEENVAGLLAAASRRTTKQVTRLLAERFGRPARATPLPVNASPGEPSGTGSSQFPAVPMEPLVSKPVVVTMDTDVAAAPVRVEGMCPPAPAAVPVRCAKVSPIAAGRYELVAIIGQEAYDQLVASQELLGHAIPSGALVEVLERAIATQLAQLRKRRCAATERPRSGTPKHSTDPRHIPAEVVRAVWERDGNQCAFVGANGHRCDSRERLELDHIVPVARGGRSTVDNLRLLCRPHNQFTAEREFGKRHIDGRREAARRRQLEERMRRQAERERAEARKAEIARQESALGEAFRSLGYRGADLARALAHCATRPEAPIEARLRHALRCMAPSVRRESPAVIAPA